MGAYFRPSRLDEALILLARASAPPLVLAGGTDLYPARVGRPIDEDVLDLTAIAALRGIAATADGWRLGATTTWSDIAEAGLPPLFAGLQAAAREVGGRQVQNAGTLAGNLCNASPAADGVPALLALDAAVEIAGPEPRRLPLRRFLLGPRRTALAPGELVVALHVPRPALPAEGAFVKLGARRYLVISIVMASAVIEFAADDTVAAARVAVGACSPVAERLPGVEAALVGVPREHMASVVAARPGLAPLQPIDDVRGSAGYRREAATELLSRLLGSFSP